MIDLHSRANLISVLENYKPFDLTEEAHRIEVLRFLTASNDPFYKTNLTGHITVSAVILNMQKNSILLLWHSKLSRWLQPGGHCEEQDKSLIDASFRELQEETGINSKYIHQVQEDIFDVDVHKIPERDNVPNHIHYDLRYLFASSINIELGIGFSWVKLEELAINDEKSLSRLAQKLLKRG